MDMSTRSENHEHDDFRGLGKVEPKSYSFWVYSNLSIYTKDGPLDPPDPISRFFVFRWKFVFLSKAEARDHFLF